MAAPSYVDLVKLSISSATPTTFTLGGAVTNFRGVEALTNTATYSWSVQQNGNAEWGRGVYNSATGTLTRGTLGSTLSGQPIPLSPGAQITFGFLAEDVQYLVGPAGPAYTGGVLSSLLTTAASTTASAGLNIAIGTAPTTPNNGDLWTTGTAIFARINNATYQLTGSYLALTGGTLTGPLITAASVAGGAGLNLAPGVAPTTPNNGDVWITTAAFQARINGVTQTVLTLAGGTLTGALVTVASAAGGSGFNVPHGATPTTPANGDLWTTTAGLFVRINGATQTAMTLAGGTLTGELITVASAAANAGFNLPAGTAPTTPANGDLWTTTTLLQVRLNGATQTVLTLAGGTLTGQLVTVASAAGGSGFNLPHGAAPTTPTNGDLWTTTGGLFARINGATVQFGSGSPITAASANAFTVGANGTTNPAFNVDTSVASVATGVNVKGAAAGGGVAISALSSGANEAMTIDAKGSGVVKLGSVSTGGVSLIGALLASTATNNSSISYTVAAGDFIVRMTAGASTTVTLPTASSNTGRLLLLVNEQSQTTVSNTSNVVPLGGGTVGTAILPATAGKWAILQSNGTSWLILAGN